VPEKSGTAMGLYNNKLKYNMVRYTVYNDLGELLSRPADTMRQAKIRARKLAKDYNNNCYIQYIEIGTICESGFQEKYQNGKWCKFGISWCKTFGAA
jgi:hypothetical protein